jgi:hypothetical protein
MFISLKEIGASQMFRKINPWYLECVRFFHPAV